MPRHLRKPSRVSIQWRLARVADAQKPIDRKWSHHSWCPLDQAESEIVHLTATQSEPGALEFRVRP